MTKLLILALAGALGAVARYAVGLAALRLIPGTFPWGTFTVNVLGCFLFGLFVGIAEHRLFLSEGGRVIVLVGFLGAFTTFSSFAFDTSILLRDQQWALAITNIAAQNVLGVCGILLGIALGRLL